MATGSPPQATALLPSALLGPAITIPADHVTLVLAGGRAWFTAAGSPSGRLRSVSLTGAPPFPDIAVGSQPSGLASGAGALWVVDAPAPTGLPSDEQNTVRRISLATGRSGPPIRVPVSGPVAGDAGGIWALGPSSIAQTLVTRIAPDGSISGGLLLRGLPPAKLVSLGGTLWAITSEMVTGGPQTLVLTAIDSPSRAVRQVQPLGLASIGALFGDGSNVWGVVPDVDPGLPVLLGFALDRLTPVRSVAIPLIGDPVTVGSSYVAIFADGTIGVLDPLTGQVSRAAVLPADAGDLSSLSLMVSDEGSLWLVSGQTIRSVSLPR